MKERLKNMKVKLKMNVYGGIMIALVIQLGIIAAGAAIFMYTQTAEITKNSVPALTIVLQLDTLTSNYRLQQYGHLSTSDTAVKTAHEQTMQAINDEIGVKREELTTYLSDDEEWALLEEIDAAWAQYLEESTEIVTLSHFGDQAQASEMMVGESKEVYDAFGESFDKLVAFEQERTDKAAKRAGIFFNIVILFVIAFIAVSILLVTILSKTLTQLITDPLQRVKEALFKLYKEGDLNFSLEYQSEDEFGELVHVINDFVKTLVIIINDENELMDQMAQGNFNITSKETDRYIGDFQQILLSMKGIKAKLGHALAGITIGAEQVNVASGQLAESSQSLAEGATQQASAVEEILATVDEVQQQALVSAQQAVDASKRAEEVQQQAQRSTGHMNDMVSEMNQISETSKEISSIIDAIEDIAAQTNLLSLNASIEAARAGEAGKGFAVVADEIGKLALQCSKSASTTRDLIETSIQQTQKGNHIAIETSQALTIVSEGIQQITEQIEVVRENCEAQHASLEEVDEGMKSIASIVESNSASAQESSATSEELAAHAETLHGLLAEFKFAAE